MASSAGTPKKAIPTRMAITSVIGGDQVGHNQTPR